MSKSVSELVRTLTYQSEDRMVTFRSLSVPEQSTVFESLSAYVQQHILKHLRDGEIVNLLDHMDMRQVEKILARITDSKRRTKIIQRLKSDVREKIDYFLRFHPDATLSHINFNYLFLSADLTVGEAANIIDEHYTETGRYPEILVHDRGVLIGEVPFASLVRERNASILKKHVIPVSTITYQASVPEVIQTIATTKSKKIVVLDHDTSVLGLIYSDTLRPLFGTLPAESLYDFTGVDNEERPFDPVRKKVYHRYRWLILNLATCFLAGSVILGFQDTLNEITILSVYIPIMAGMASNAAAQSFAIMVRGISLGTISLEQSMPALMREAGAGFLNGGIIAIIVVFISTIWNESFYLGLVVGLALILALMIGVVSGALIPLLMKHYGKDPAAGSSIFITTVTDVISFLLLFGLATLFLV